MKVLATAFLAPFLLIGAAYPDSGTSEAGPSEARESPAAAVSYRPCRPGPGDDNCIQLYERGVRQAYAEWRGERAPEARPTRLAMGGPEVRAQRPRPASAPAHDPRCIEGEVTAGERHGAGETRGM